MAEFRGILYVFVDIPSEGKDVAPIAEVFGSAAIGERLWFQVGWAVSNNARRTYCGRTSTSKLLKFTSFTDASNFVRTVAKRRPDHRFYIVYEVDGTRTAVDSLDDIHRLDSSATVQAHETADVPEGMIDRLGERVGKVVAANALELLTILRQDGEAAARTRFSSATYDRLHKVLSEEGLLAA